MEKNFIGCSLVLPPKEAIPPNFAKKTYVNSYNTSNLAKIFSLEIFTAKWYFKINTVAVLVMFSGSRKRV